MAHSILGKYENKSGGVVGAEITQGLQDRTCRTKENRSIGEIRDKLEELSPAGHTQHQLQLTCGVRSEELGVMTGSLIIGQIELVW